MTGCSAGVGRREDGSRCGKHQQASRTRHVVKMWPRMSSSLEKASAAAEAASLDMVVLASLALRPRSQWGPTQPGCGGVALTAGKTAVLFTADAQAPSVPLAGAGGNRSGVGGGTRCFVCKELNLSALKAAVHCALVTVRCSPELDPPADAYLCAR